MRLLLMNTSPSSGESSPPIILSRLDLPDPEGPINATNSPSLISRLMLVSAVSDLKILETDFILIISSILAQKLIYAGGCSVGASAGASVEAVGVASLELSPDTSTLV